MLRKITRASWRRRKNMINFVRNVQPTKKKRTGCHGLQGRNETAKGPFSVTCRTNRLPKERKISLNKKQQGAISSCCDDVFSYCENQNYYKIPYSISSQTSAQNVSSSLLPSNALLSSFSIMFLNSFANCDNCNSSEKSERSFGSCFM